MTAPCPRCGRQCDEIDTPSHEHVFACDNCERGDDGGYDVYVSRAMGPLTFTLDEANDADDDRHDNEETTP